MSLSVYCIKYARSVLPESLILDGGNPEKDLPISFAVYLIKSGDKKILVDAGCDTMPNFDMRQYYSPAFVLRQVDLSADDITDLVITHAHHDHIAAASHFKKAILHISEAEYNMGKRYIPSDMQLHIFRGGFNLTEQIKIVEWGGHSAGSCFVEITLDNKIHILTGDECYTNKNITDKICTGSFFCKEKATEFVHKFSNAKYCVHTCHDISLKTERII